MSVSIFWDNSNIWLVGRNVCEHKEKGHEFEFRIHFENLINFVANWRDVSYVYAASSVPPPNDGVWKQLGKLNVQLEIQPRALNKEVAVDEVIQLAMLNRASDIYPNHETFILLTGDGAGYDQGKGFIKQLERIRKFGNDIEVVSWDLGCNQRLKKFAKENGLYRPLELVYKRVTFINDFRWVK